MPDDHLTTETSTLKRGLPGKKNVSYGKFDPPIKWRRSSWTACHSVSWARSMIEFCRRSASVDFVVVGPETPLCGGDRRRSRSGRHQAFGPAAAAQLEGSKGFTKDCAASPIYRPAPIAASIRCDALA